MVKLNSNVAVLASMDFEEPQPKVLDQSIFNGLDEKWRFAAVDKCGEVWACTDKVFSTRDGVHLPSNNQDTLLVGQYDASNWQNSLIERESKELAGNDCYYSKIASKLLKDGQKQVVCFASNVSEADALSEKHIEVIICLDVQFDDTDGYGWDYVIPINNQGEPLTASEVGL
jgi:hypothetical protein